MYNSSEEYLYYLQNVLKQVDITEYVNSEYTEIVTDRVNVQTPDGHEKNLKETFNQYKKIYDPSVENFNDYSPEEYTLKIIVEQIKNSIKNTFKNSIEKIAIGGIYKLFPDAKIFKNSNNHCAVLISTAMIKVIYNNISLLEATTVPKNVEFCSFISKNISDITSYEYNEIHKNYLAFIRESQYPESIILTFNKYSTEMVIRHFEIIIAFIIFHEFSHFINGDIDNTNNINNTLFITKKDIEFKADETAIDLMIKYYLPNFEYSISPLELILMIEYYFFRVIYLLNIESTEYPSSGERIINLLEKAKIKYNVNENKLNKNILYLKYIYSMEEL